MEYLQVGVAPVEGYGRTGCFAAEASIVRKPYVRRWKAAICANNEVQILEELHGSGREECQYYLAVGDPAV